MKKYILKTLITVLFLGFSCSIATAQEQDKERIVLLKERCEIPVNYLYRMPIKEYSPKMVEHVAGKNRYVIRYKSDNESVVRSNGNTFIAKSVGTAQVTMNAYKAVPGTTDQADLNSPLGKATFTVEVKQDTPFVMAPIDIPWGHSREAATAILEQHGLKHFTSTYWDMHPNVPEESRVGLEAYLSDNLDFPVSLLMFNSKNQLYRKTLIASSWERVKIPKICAVWKWLKEHGFEDKGIDTNTNMWKMYQASTKTNVTVGYLAFQSTLYMYVDFLYEDAIVDSVEKIAGNPDITPEISQRGRDLTLRHPHNSEGSVVVYNTTGERVGEEKLVNGECELKNLPSGLLFITASGAKTVKVMIPHL